MLSDLVEIKNIALRRRSKICLSLSVPILTSVSLYKEKYFYWLKASMLICLFRFCLETLKSETHWKSPSGFLCSWHLQNAYLLTLRILMYWHFVAMVSVSCRKSAIAETVLILWKFTSII